MHFLWMGYLNTFQTAGTTGYHDRFAQFDELIAIGNVNAMLTPESARHFVFHTISGSTVMYGRFVFYVDAAVSFIPYKIWGLTGQIIATRWAHAAVLMWAFYLLIITFIPRERTWLRTATALLLCLIPYSLYFSIVPKPEPYQLLCLALFFYYDKKGEHQSFKPFVWLGLAFATKISTIGILPVVGIYFLLRNKAPMLNRIVKPLAWFMTGVFIGVPTLLLGLVKRIYLESYISHTFGTIRQDYDDSSIDALQWLGYMGRSYFVLHPALLLPLLTALVVAAVMVLRKKGLQTHHIVLLTGIVLLVLVALNTHRMWPHYLYIGWVMVFVGLAASLADFYKGLPVVIVLALIALCETGNLADNSRYLMSREQQPEYISAKTAGEKALGYLEGREGASPIAGDITLYVPNAFFVKACRYQPFASDKAAKLRYNQINNYGQQLYDNNNSIVFFRNNPATGSIANPGSAMPDQLNGGATFQANVPARFKRDTAFGGVEIYIRQ